MAGDFHWRPGEPGINSFFPVCLAFVGNALLASPGGPFKVLDFKKTVNRPSEIFEVLVPTVF